MTWRWEHYPDEYDASWDDWDDYRHPDDHADWNLFQVAALIIAVELALLAAFLWGQGVRPPW